MDAELAQSEASHDRVAVLVINIAENNTDKITVETQTEEQHAAACAQKQTQYHCLDCGGRCNYCEHDRGCFFPAEIALALGKGLKRNDIFHRWNHHLKVSDKLCTILEA